MAHRVDAVEQVAPGVDVADVELVGAVRGRRSAVGLREHQVHPDQVVSAGVELLGDRRADEAGRTGQQDLHGIS